MIVSHVHKTHKHEFKKEQYEIFISNVILRNDDVKCIFFFYHIKYKNTCDSSIDCNLKTSLINIKS